MTIDQAKKRVSSPRQSDGLGVADTYLVGVTIKDAQEAQQKRIEGRGSRPSGFMADLIASIVNGISNVPDALATSFMAGVSPIHGLYATILAPPVSSLTSSSQLMISGVTVAAAVSTGQTLSFYPEAERVDAMIILAILTGLFLIAFGLLKLGRLMKYISYPVMRGFLYGVGLLLILNSIPDLVGYQASGPNAFVTLWDTSTHIGSWNGEALLIAVITFAIIFLVQKTPLKMFASLAALLAASLIVYWMNFDTVQIVQDISTIPQGLPLPQIPKLSDLSVNLIVSALSLAAIIAIQGMGVSQMAENPDESPVDTSQDMMAQGFANIASGVFAGLPVGASIGSTALNLAVGAASRLTGILTGVWMLLIVLFFAKYVEQVPMPALTALIVMAGFGAVNVRDAQSILRSGWSAILGFTVTLLSVIFFSIPLAVMIGIVLSIIFNFVATANDVEVKHLRRTPEGDYIEEEMPEYIPSNDPMVITVSGHLFFAGAKTLEEKLPKVGEAEHPVVIIRFRSTDQMGATLIDVLDRYAEDLEENGGKLYLSALEDSQIKLLEASGKLERGVEAEWFEREDLLMGSTEKAFEHAEAWISSQGPPRIKNS